MEDDISGALAALAAAHNWLGVAERCEEALLTTMARGGGGHPCYAAHALALLSAGRMESARHLWRQRTALAPQPPTAAEQAATRAAQAAWSGDIAGAHAALTGTAWSAELAAMAGAASDALRARGVRRVAAAYRHASAEAVAAQCAVPLGRVGELAVAHGWAVDDGGRVAPKAGGVANKVDVGGMERVRDLAEQLVRMQTS